MPLSAGTRLGPYAIEALIGEGGMGQVYRARDKNLERDVAIKVLPDVWAGDSDRLARFRREAHLIASLNHPHIAQIYGVETSSGAAGPAPITTALVMELVEGPTLADRIAEGPLSVAEAVAIARQIADALDAAHEQGIVHRDLKPANVKVREDGTVKVLDFGLAKTMDVAAAVASSPSMSPTLTSPAFSQLGMVLGTAAYMSPEQARGKAVDKRTDIWAFGCVLFEMLAGRRPFDGEDVTETMASVVKGEPAWTLLPRGVPSRIVRLLRRCLEKDRRLRLRDIGDARIELTDDAVDDRVATAASAKGVWLERMAWLAALVVVAALGAGAWFRSPPAAAPGSVTRFTIALPEGQRIAGGTKRLSISPDGTSIVYVANGQLYRRDLRETEPQLIQGSNENPAYPEFSPDGGSIAYIALDSANTFVVKRIPAAGGTSVKIIDVGSTAVAGGWAPTDVSIHWKGQRIVGSRASGIWSAPATGGVPETLLSLDPSVEVATLPRLLRDDRHLLYTVRRVAEAGPEAWSVVSEDVGGGNRKVLLRAARLVAMLPTGHLVYLRGSDLMAAAFDEQRLEVTGDPVVMATGFGGQVAVSANGTIVSQPPASPGLRSIVWVDRYGAETPLPIPPQNGGYLRLSPDNTRLAITSGSEIRVWSFERKTMTRLNEAGAGHWDAVWMADGRRIAFSAGGNFASLQVLMKAADGSGPATVIVKAPAGYPNALSPDGRFLLFHKGVGELTIQSLDPPEPPRQLLKGIALNAVFSPDGRWIAYQSSEGNRMEISVRAFPDTEAGRWQVSSNGGKYPLWSADGRELFYVDGSGMLLAVPVDTQGGFATGAPVQLFRTDPYIEASNSRPYDVSRDGKRFILAKLSTEVRPTINVVTNWLQEVVEKLKSQQKAAR